RGAVGINGRVKYLPLAWAWMPKTSFRKNSDSPASMLAAMPHHAPRLKIVPHRDQQNVLLLREARQNLLPLKPTLMMSGRSFSTTVSGFGYGRSRPY
ncbi:hypothetical protein BOW53_16735, partial [Solemya pervernicosa gill symbiont]